LNFFEKDINVSPFNEILKFAINAEKDTIIFYIVMKDAISNDYNINKIDEIIKKEMNHITLLIMVIENTN
jgi:rubrerythrin